MFITSPLIVFGSGTCPFSKTPSDVPVHCKSPLAQHLDLLSEKNCLEWPTERLFYGIAIRIFKLDFWNSKYISDPPKRISQDEYEWLLDDSEIGTSLLGYFQVSDAVASSGLQVANPIHLRNGKESLPFIKLRADYGDLCKFNAKVGSRNLLRVTA